MGVQGGGSLSLLWSSFRISLTCGAAGSPGVVYSSTFCAIPHRLYLQEVQWKNKSIGELFSPSPMALSRNPGREIKRGQLINSFLCLLPPCAFLSCFRWTWGPELVLRTPHVLEAAFLYKFGTELATRDWKYGRQSWLDVLRRACGFTAACPLGLQWKTRLSTANICTCESIVLSEDEISRWRELRTKLKSSF